MKLTIDTDSGVLTTQNSGICRDIPLYSREAFELISRECADGLGGALLLHLELVRASGPAIA